MGVDPATARISSASCEQAVDGLSVVVELGSLIELPKRPPTRRIGLNPTLLSPSHAHACENKSTGERQVSMANEEVGAELSQSVVERNPRHGGSGSNQHRKQCRADLRVDRQDGDTMCSQHGSRASMCSVSTCASSPHGSRASMCSVSSLASDSDSEQGAAPFSMLGEPLKVEVRMALPSHPLKIDLTDLAAAYSELAN